jgi:ribosome-binding factor A
MAGRKRQHLNESIRQKLGQLLYKEAGDPRFQAVTITAVELSQDFSFAKVQFSTYARDADPAALTLSLNRAAGFFGRLLGRTLQARRTPRLHFVYDPGFDHAQEMDILLKEVLPPEEPHE